MELVKWNPMKDMFSLRNRINAMFDDFFYPTTRSESDWGLSSWEPRVDIYDDKDNIVIKAEMPGVDKKDIKVDVKDRVLTLSGERSADKEVKEDSYYRRERTFGRFERSFTLPGEVDPEKIAAEYKDGVLKIVVPKPEEQKPKQITIH